MRRDMTMITIKEIADIVGVSTTTVSNVIHGKTKKVSKENIEKIKKVLKEENYIPRMGLSTLTNTDSRIIGVVIHITKHYEDTILSDPFYGQIVGFLEKHIRESGYYMMLYTSEDLNDIFKMTVAWNVDGLIAITFTDKNYQKLRSLIDKPIVAIDLFNETGKDHLNVGLDDEQGGYLMTKYLLECGFRHILFLAHQDVGVDHRRYLGHIHALKEHNIEVKENHFVKLDEYAQKRKKQYKELMQFVNREYAMFFMSDLLASEAMRYFIEQSISIPEDISIAGFDDNLYGRFLTPQLTSVHQDINLKAKKAIELLLKALNDGPIEQNDIILPVQLAIRGTVKRMAK